MKQGDNRASGSPDKAHEGSLIFMTDPICSWCWGMLPEILLLQEALSERLEFKLKCAGLQVGSRQPLREDQANELIALWQRVAETTGQKFAFALPPDATFIYHSELACRVLQVVRELEGTEPWQLFSKLQHAFYVDCCNISDLEALYSLFDSHEISQEDFMHMMTTDLIKDLTRKEFDWCQGQGIQALPTLFLDLGEGPRLISGGYATAEYLVPEILARLKTH